MVITSAGAAQCAECKFFESESTADLGLCRYNPPISQPSAETRGVWPKVASSDWCGHFTAEISAAE